MSFQRRVYLLDPQKIPPETIAVAFAKTSRSPQPFQEIANGLTEAKSAEFHEKRVVECGHTSIAEHAVLHIAVENISRLAKEILEANRLASDTEKSTRYEMWDPTCFHTPKELENHPLKKTYEATCRKLLDTYHQVLPQVKSVVANKNPQKPGERDSAWEQRIRSRFADVCRYLLPVSALANVGVTINARSLEYALCKMLSHRIAQEIRIHMPLPGTFLRETVGETWQDIEARYFIQTQ